jgi:two-component system response regulator AlgR
MNVLIVDDEQLARQRLRHMLSGMGEHVVGEAANGEQALQQTQNNSPDVVLLDIRMPGMDGLEAAGYINQMENPPAIIFTTAYTDHALKAFETHAVDYLLKPIKQDRLANAINAAKRLTRAQIEQLRNDEMSEVRSKICVKSRGSLELVPIEDIIYFKADQKYVTLKTDDHEYLIEESLKHWKQNLPTASCASTVTRLCRRTILSACLKTTPVISVSCSMIPMIPSKSAAVIYRRFARS